MTAKRQVVKRSPPVLIYKQSVKSHNGGPCESLHLAIVGVEPVFCGDLVLAAALFSSIGCDSRVMWRP